MYAWETAFRIQVNLVVLRSSFLHFHSFLTKASTRSQLPNKQRNGLEVDLLSTILVV